MGDVDDDHGPESTGVDDPAAGDPTIAIREAIDSASIGADGVGVALSNADAVGTISVRDGVASVEVTLPVPSDELRERVASAVATAARTVDEVEEVEVGFRAVATDPGEQIELLPDVKHVVAVASGKGGVGKSTVAANLAVSLADAGASVGLLDADVYGPNAPALFGLDEATPDATLDDEVVPREAHGVRVMSMGFVAGEDDPVIWRGPLVDEFLKQLFGDVQWGALDYLVVDMPPGTGDAQLSLVQHLPVSGAVVVTTPPEVAVDDAARGLVGFARFDVPILGVVENMAGFECPDCGEVHDVFGTGGGSELAEEFEVPVLGRVPLDPAVGTLAADDEDGSTPGIDLPLVGRLQLPRTRQERSGGGTLPPVALRDDAGETRAALRRAATRAAARANQAAVELDT